MGAGTERSLNGIGLYPVANRKNTFRNNKPNGHKDDKANLFRLIICMYMDLAAGISSSCTGVVLYIITFTQKITPKLPLECRRSTVVSKLP